MTSLRGHPDAAESLSYREKRSRQAQEIAAREVERRGRDFYREMGKKAAEARRTKKAKARTTTEPASGRQAEL